MKVRSGALVGAVACALALPAAAEAAQITLGVVPGSGPTLQAIGNSNDGTPAYRAQFNETIMFGGNALGDDGVGGPMGMNFWEIRPGGESQKQPGFAANSDGSWTRSQTAYANARFYLEAPSQGLPPVAATTYSNAIDVYVYPRMFVTRGTRRGRIFLQGGVDSLSTDTDGKLVIEKKGSGGFKQVGSAITLNRAGEIGVLLPKKPGTYRLTFKAANPANLLDVSSGTYKVKKKKKKRRKRR